MTENFKSAIKNKNIFLSGPITGVKNFREKFNEIENIIKPICNYVFNPADITKEVKGTEFLIDQYGFLTNEKATWTKCMKRTIRELAEYEFTEYQTIIMLPGWKASKGATLELSIAAVLKLKVLYWDNDFKPLKYVTVKYGIFNK